MATESPLLHDGSQCVASTNLSSTGSNGNIYGYQYCPVVMSSATSRQVSYPTNSNLGQYGVLQNRPSSGQAADVGFLGITKGFIGVGGITAGMNLMVSTAPSLIAFTSGTKVGFSLETVSSGNIATVFIYPNVGVST